MFRGILMLMVSTGVGFSLWVNPTANSPAIAGDGETLAQTGGASLEVSDLPPGFAPAPAFVRELILKSIESLNPELKKQGVVVERVTAFIDVEQGEIVVALTAHLSNPLAIEAFDAGLNRPNSSETFVTGLQQSLSALGQVKVNQVRELEGMKGIGEIAKGFGIDGELEGWSLTVAAEAIAFRRGRTGVLVIAGALAHKVEGVGVRDLALRLDRRLSLKANSRMVATPPSE